jgi:hypothetical protein
MLKTAAFGLALYAVLLLGAPPAPAQQCECKPAAQAAAKHTHKASHARHLPRHPASKAVAWPAPLPPPAEPSRGAMLARRMRNEAIARLPQRDSTTVFDALDDGFVQLGRMFDMDSSPWPQGVYDAPLGLAVAGMSPRIATELNMDWPHGVFVVAVFPNSPADEMGLADGDVLISFNGHTITSPSDLKWAMTKTPYQNYAITVWRDGESFAFGFQSYETLAEE